MSTPKPELYKFTYTINPHYFLIDCSTQALAEKVQKAIPKEFAVSGYRIDPQNGRKKTMSILHKFRIMYDDEATSKKVDTFLKSIQVKDSGSCIIS